MNKLLNITAYNCINLCSRKCNFIVIVTVTVTDIDIVLAKMIMTQDANVITFFVHSPG